LGGCLLRSLSLLSALVVAALLEGLALVDALGLADAGDRFEAGLQRLDGLPQQLLGVDAAAAQEVHLVVVLVDSQGQHDETGVQVVVGDAAPRLATDLAARLRMTPRSPSSSMWMFCERPDGNARVMIRCCASMLSFGSDAGRMGIVVTAVPLTDPSNRGGFGLRGTFV
jgi:hypothetical protein